MKELIKDHWLELASFIASVSAGFWSFVFADLGGACEDHPTAVISVAVASLFAGVLLGNALPCFKRYRRMQAIKRALDLVTPEQAGFIRELWGKRSVRVKTDDAVLEGLQVLGLVPMLLIPDAHYWCNATLKREVMELFARDGVDKYLP